MKVLLILFLVTLVHAVKIHYPCDSKRKCDSGLECYALSSSTSICRKSKGVACDSAVECASRTCTKNKCADKCDTVKNCLSQHICDKNNKCVYVQKNSNGKFNQKCNTGNTCEKGLTCSADVCLKVDSSYCNDARDCASFICANHVCTAKCSVNKDCFDDYYCAADKKCAKKGENGAKCSDYTQCSQSNAQRGCYNDVCSYHGAKPGENCKGKTCIVGYYCDTSSNTCKEITGGCTVDSDCTNKGWICCSGKCGSKSSITNGC
jgi:hypothetical protein